MDHRPNKENSPLTTHCANCLASMEGMTNHSSENSHLPVVQTASSKSATRSTQGSVAGVSSCIPLPPLPLPPIKPILRPIIQPVQQFRREPTPNLLYMTTIPGNRAPRDDDDFSVISEQLEDYQIPNDLLLADIYTPAREDGRKPGIIDFVQNIVEKRAPERRSYKRIALTTAQFCLTIFDHLLKFLVIYLFVMAIYYCHEGKCTNRTDHYYGNADRVRRIFEIM